MDLKLFSYTCLVTFLFLSFFVNVATVAAVEQNFVKMKDVQLDGYLSTGGGIWNSYLWVGDSPSNLTVDTVIRFNNTNYSYIIDLYREDIEQVLLWVYISDVVNNPHDGITVRYNYNETWDTTLKGRIGGNYYDMDYLPEYMISPGWYSFDITYAFLEDDNLYSTVTLYTEGQTEDGISNGYKISGSESGRTPQIQIFWNEYLPPPHPDINYTLRNNITAGIVYERLWDARPKRTVYEHIDIIRDLQPDFIFRSNWRVYPMVDSCDIYEGDEYTACVESGYTKELQSEIISAIKAEKPNIKIIGALMSQRINKNETDEWTGVTYNETETYAMALDPAKWGMASPTKAELQESLTGGIGGLGSTVWFPDITNSDFQQLLIDQAKQQIDSGVDGIWIDYLFSQCELFLGLDMEYGYTPDQVTQSARDAYFGSKYVIEEIRKYGDTVGRPIYVGTWRNPAFRYTVFYENSSALPNIDFFSETITRKEMEYGVDQQNWINLTANTNEVFGNIPIIAKIDWTGKNSSPISYFSQNLTGERDSDFLLSNSTFFETINVSFMYPVHGGSMFIGAPNLSYGIYNWYDAKAPEFDTYPAIKFLLNPSDPSGYVFFQDVDGSINPLPDAVVQINETTVTTNETGYYIFYGEDNSIHTATASYNSAVSTQTKTISDASNPNNFTLLFSKPAMSKPSHAGNYLTGTFSTNFKSLNLWEIPNFMWGEYYYEDYINTSNDHNFYEQCAYQGSNVFSCNAPQTSSNYTFRFVFSDMYNMNLSQYHPTLTGYRNFTSDYIYIQNGDGTGTGTGNTGDFKSISNLPQVNREQATGGWFVEGAFWLIMTILVLGFLSLGSIEKKKKKKGNQKWSKK